METQERSGQNWKEQQERGEQGEREGDQDYWASELEYREEDQEDGEQEPEYGEASQEEEGGKKTRIIYRIGAAVCGVMFVCALVYFASYYARQKHGEQVYEEMRQEQSPEAEKQEEIQNLQETGEAERSGENQEAGEQEPEEEELQADLSLRRKNTIDFQALKEQNSHVCAWISIPGTKVDYPVLQHPSADDYYLNHTIDLVEGLPGSIYIESVHPADFSAVHSVLYGHNMKNGTMFGSLHSYEDPKFFKENPYVYVYLPDRTLLYQIYGAVRFSDAYLPEYCSYEEEESFLAFTQELKASQGQVNTELEVPFGSRILTLSTCIANDGTHRFLVGAVLIDEYE